MGMPPLLRPLPSVAHACRIARADSDWRRRRRHNMKPKRHAAMQPAPIADKVIMSVLDRSVAMLCASSLLTRGGDTGGGRVGGGVSG